MSFRLDEHGAVFSTRSRGSELRKLALASHPSGDTLRISFSGVQSVSYSFADEFLGPLMLGGDPVILEDVSAPIHRIIMSTMRRRNIRVDEQTLFAACA
jgi:hypothetical protein